MWEPQLPTSVKGWNNIFYYFRFIIFYESTSVSQKLKNLEKKSKNEKGKLSRMIVLISEPNTVGFYCIGDKLNNYLSKKIILMTHLKKKKERKKLPMNHDEHSRNLLITKMKVAHEFTITHAKKKKKRKGKKSKMQKTSRVYH